MTAALEAALVGRAAVIVADGSATVASVIDAVRATPPQYDMILLAITATVPKLDRLMVLAAVGPLAAEVATERRIAALDVAAGAESSDVVAAALFLAEARSTTGQVLRITPRG